MLPVGWQPSKKSSCFIKYCIREQIWLFCIFQTGVVLITMVPGLRCSSSSPSV
ncbi:hypothetical protein HanIR_Chr10g0477881 [Helianthus annuus]|nr:hypothetical protein HanIR_Chr10g0477881 [Helianthus annuus]